MVGAMALMTTTIPMIVATAGTVHVMNAAFKKNGKPMGMKHWHYKGKRAVSHRHEGGSSSHYHRGLRGYGRNRGTLRRF